MGSFCRAGFGTLQSHKPFQTHSPSTSGFSTLRVEFETAGSRYFASMTSPILLTQNSANWMQQQGRNHCNTSMLLRDFTARWKQLLSLCSGSIV
jgi:hypothetical protein